ncbi:MAG: hypothetical protein O7A08_12500 [SAR324 cluster bacterium]|nr:hypothetical protein [SAR324 cluster bacterium]MCZ6533771.1 hypothetical protein [SAR324 cluster bacterium]MCZ6557398.1 hypothetical protein [SAR324 cluster bacterium]MCZ6626644.1 hypothetical protein [SAR324 cluster bacterium]MCZ6844209.1 hypothetical protein [SAR324 cluster bacterium]
MAMDVAFKTKVSELNPRAREWFATAIVGMVLADGNIDRSEMDFLLKVIQLVPDPDVVDRLKKFVQFKTVPPIGSPPGIDRKMGMSMIIDLIRVAVSDKDFDKKEKEMVAAVGKSLGFKPDEVDKLVLYGFELMTQ